MSAKRNSSGAQLSLGIQPDEHGCLRFHRVPSALWRDAHKRVFFEPRPGTLRLFEKFNEPVKKLVSEWWERIVTSQKFADNHADISAYHKTLKPGDVTLVAAKAPAYLHPSAQLKLLHTAADCLAVLELAVNWETEKLYGVEGLGSFDEF